MQKMQVDYKPNQNFLYLKEQTIWSLVDITEVQSLILKRDSQTIVHLFNKDTKKIKRLRFSEFEVQFRLINNELTDKVIFLNKLLLTEAINYFD